MIEMHPTIRDTPRATIPWVPTLAIGQPSSPDSAAMPKVEPMPNNAKYVRRAPIDGIVAMTNAVRAPLPARPWTAPTSSGRRASVHGPPIEPILRWLRAHGNGLAPLAPDWLISKSRGQTFRGHQTLQRGQPVLVVARTVIGFAAIRGGLEFVGQRSCPLFPREMPLFREFDGQRECLRLPRLGKHRASRVAEQMWRGRERLGFHRHVVRLVRGSRPTCPGK